LKNPHCRINDEAEFSIPASRWRPQYNKAAFQKVMAENQIDPVFAGQQLGGRRKIKPVINQKTLT